MPRDPSIDGGALQWSNLKGPQRKIVSDNIRETGLNIREHAERAVETTRRSKNTTPGKVETAQGVAENVKPQAVTLQKAANTRQGFYERGLADRRAANPDDPHQVIPTGAGWYFEHHREIAESAEKHGFNRDNAIAASGVMSPQNSPENERAAVSAIADTVANRKVHMTPEVHKHLTSKGLDIPQEHVGKTVYAGDLPSGSIAHLSSLRGQVQTDADLYNVARGGTKQNIAKAEKVLSGEVHPDDAVNPHSAPKVWSYVHNTRQAVPNSATHVEYMGRVHQDALVRSGQIDKEQQALDLYGFQEKEKRGELPDDHLLSPKSHTVEDTWQNAATFNQPNKTVPGTKTSVYKAGGSLPTTYPVAGVKTRVNEETGKRETAHPDARIGNAALTHAYNNRATQKAAEQLSRESGTTVPPVAVQEVGWVQMRKEAGKDPAWNNRAQEKADPLEGHVRGQGALFDITDRSGQVRSHLPGAGRTPLDRPEPEMPSNDVDMSDADKAKDLARHEAIYNARRSKARRSNLSGGQFG